MIRLTVVELRRLFSRRLVLLAMLASLAVVALMLVVTWTTVQPMSAAEQAQAEQFYADELERWAEHGDEQVASCEEAEASESEATGEDVDYGCDQMAPQREWYVVTPPSFADTLPTLLGVLSTALVFLPLLIGTTFTAAELSTGSMSNWLTFEPRRGLVYASKLVAAALGVVPMTLVALVGSIGGAWLINDAQGLTDSMTAEVWTDVTWTAVRILALAVVVSAVGAALGFLLRHTAAVLGLAVGYGIVVEGVLGSVLPALSPWKLLLNIESWVQDGTSYWVYECTTDAGGTMCDGVEKVVTLDHSAWYLLVLCTAVILLGAVLFRRRDAA